MATNDERRGSDPKMDAATLYLEEVFTDRRIGTIRRLTPVKPDATTDVARPVVYVGETQVMTQVGTLPIAFEIPASTLEDAAKKFGDLAKEAIERTMRELQELRRQQASSIVVPQGGMPPAGGMGGGGKIQLP
ncbi:MAG: hypothetical protein ACREVQ_08460 [Burkholderiales bacterium]